MQSRLKSGVIAAAFGIALLSGASVAHAQTIVGLSTTNAVFTTNVANVNNIASTSVLALQGFVNPSAATAVGIDLRPNGSGLYTLLSVEETSAQNASLVGRLYDVDITTGFLTNARQVTGTNVNFLAPGGTTPTRYTIDYNPTTPAVALRIVGSDGSNYRVTNPLDGTAVQDSALGQTGVVGVGYNNNVPGATSTQSFYTSATSSSLLTTAQGSNANNPVLTTVGTGLGIGLDSGGLQEIDIAANGVAYGSFQLANENFSRFYTVDTTAGTASAVGGNNAFRVVAGNGNSANLSVRAFSVVATVVPEASTFALAIPALGLLGAVAVRRRKTA